jgi:hypothetical protein
LEMLVNEVEIKENVAFIKVSPRCPKGRNIKKDFFLKLDKEDYLRIEAMPQKVALYQILNYKPEGDFNLGALVRFMGTDNYPFNFTKLLLLGGNKDWEMSRYLKKVRACHKNGDHLDFTRKNLEIRA